MSITDQIIMPVHNYKAYLRNLPNSIPSDIVLGWQQRDLWIFLEHNPGFQSEQAISSFLWGHSDVKTKANLRQHVRNINQLLARAGKSPLIEVNSRFGYQLKLGWDRVVSRDPVSDEEALRVKLRLYLHLIEEMIELSDSEVVSDTYLLMLQQQGLFRASFQQIDQLWESSLRQIDSATIAS